MAEDSRALVGGGLALESSSAQVGSWVLGWEGRMLGLPVRCRPEGCLCLLCVHVCSVKAGCLLAQQLASSSRSPLPAPCLRPAGAAAPAEGEHGPQQWWRRAAGW